jgi:hypothetical protein
MNEEETQQQILQILKTGEKSLAKLASLCSPPQHEWRVMNALGNLRSTGLVELLKYGNDSESFPFMYRLTQKECKQ